MNIFILICVRAGQVIPFTQCIDVSEGRDDNMEDEMEDEDQADDPSVDEEMLLDEMEDGDEADDPEVAFYNLARKKKKHVCPFADEQRRHRCPMSSDMKQKDRVQHHLQQIIVDGYDEGHPRDDPLWQTALVAKYYLKSRPTKFNRSKAKKQVSKYNASY
jgi:hypothetical protein